MTENGSEAEKKILEVTVLCRTCHQLNSQRIELDRRIIGLRADDPSSDVLWQELAIVLMNLQDAARRLAQVSAPHLTDVRSKANVLAILLHSVSANGPVISDDQIRALALSLADDIVGLLDNCAAWST